MKKLNDLFQELGISKVRLAKYLGVSRQMVYNYLELDDINKYEDELISLGLDIPFVHKLKRKLIDKGIIVNGDTLDELVEQLCK